MNCDRAFDLLTDSAGRGSLALQMHLAECSRCRQMQETLAPALDWLEDATAGEDPAEANRTTENDARFPCSIAAYATSPHGARGAGSAEALAIALESADRLTAQTAPRPKRNTFSFGVVARGAALVALGALFAIAFVPGAKPVVPEKDARRCLRLEAAAAASRSVSEFEALVATCTTCHEPNGALRHHDQKSITRLSGRSWQLVNTVWEFQALLPTLVMATDHNILCVDVGNSCFDHKIVNCFDKPRARWL